MNLETATQKSTELVDGRYAAVTTEKNDDVNGILVTKITTYVVRPGNYAHAKGVVAKGKPNPNKQPIVRHILSYNTNTKRYSFSFLTTQVLPRNKYYVGGRECDKETYERYVPAKKRYGEFPKMMSFNIENVVKVVQRNKKKKK